MLVTGDGSLNSKPRRKGVETFLTPYCRLEKTTTFQVMHLGASRNSSPEVPTLVAPCTSIFCAAPSKGNKHPYADVLRQFLSYNCIQVHDAIDWLILGVFEFYVDKVVRDCWTEGNGSKRMFGVDLQCQFRRSLALESATEPRSAFGLFGCGTSRRIMSIATQTRS